MGRRAQSSRRDVMDVVVFRRKLISWWQINGRTFPWRNTRQPYLVLVAEVLLHRTRANQVVPLYLEFTRRFRSWRRVAHASLTELRRLLRPLGLNWRVEQFHRM